MEEGFYTSKDFLPLVSMASKPGIYAMFCFVMLYMYNIYVIFYMIYVIHYDYMIHSNPQTMKSMSIGEKHKITKVRTPISL